MEARLMDEDHQTLKRSCAAGFPGSNREHKLSQLLLRVGSTPKLPQYIGLTVRDRILPVLRSGPRQPSPAREPSMENCESLSTDAKLAGKLLALAVDFRRQAAEPGVPQELRVELVGMANSLCETALYILKKG